MEEQASQPCGKGKRRYRLLVVMMTAAYLSYAVTNRYVFHSKQHLLFLLSVVFFVLTCLGFRWAKRMYYVCAAAFIGMGTILLFGLIYHALRFGELYHRWFTCVFAGILGAAHGISAYLLHTASVRTYLTTKSKERRR